MAKIIFLHLTIYSIYLNLFKILMW